MTENEILESLKEATKELNKLDSYEEIKKIIGGNEKWKNIQKKKLKN